VEFTASDGSIASFADLHGILADFSFIKHFHAGTFTNRTGATTIIIFAVVEVPVWIDIEVSYAFATMSLCHVFS
jgi:hypothetical protein